jgi:AraC-like DNA-binding protein
MEEIYLISAWLSIGTTFTFGLCFLLLAAPDKPILTKYRNARKIIAAAYLLLSVMNALEMLTRHNTPDMPLTWTLILIMSAAQSLLFTFTFIALINPHFSTNRKIVRKIVPIAALSAVQVITLFLPQRAGFQIVFYIFIAYSALMLVHYTYIFLKNYRQYVVKVDNFYSEQEEAYLRWILAAFFMALMVGIGALLLAFTENTLWFILFTLLFIVFYSYFGIKFINYGFKFDEIESVIQIPQSNHKQQKNSDLSDKIAQWEAAKKYIKQGITVKQMAADIHTNRQYLSDFISNSKHLTFRDYINSLRIAEAQRLLAENPSATIADISDRTGFSDISNFSKVFPKFAGKSFLRYRKGL